MKGILKKRGMSVFLTFALIVSLFAGTDSTRAQAAERSKIIVYVAAQGESADGTLTVDVPKTAVQLDAGATAFDAIDPVLDKACNGNYVISDGAWGKSLDEIGGLAPTDDWSSYWSFFINGGYSEYGIGNYVLADQDQISLIYISDWAITEAQCDCYADDVLLNPDAERQSELIASAKKQQDLLAQTIFDTVFAGGSTVPGIENSDGLYAVFSLARAGFEAPDFYDAVVTKVNAQLSAIRQGKEIYVPETGTDISAESILNGGYAEQTTTKIALCMEALGQDPTDVGGVNLIDLIVDKSVYEASNAYITSREAMMLFALDAVDAVLPEGENYLTRRDLIDAILAEVDEQVNLAVSGYLDRAAMIIQALAPYADSDEEVNSACAQVISLLETMQNTDASYNDAWALAQMMTTMGLFGITATSEKDGSDFIKNGNTVFDASAAFVDTAQGTVDAGLLSYQPEQLLRGLNSCLRAEQGEALLYDVTDVAYTAKDLGNYEVQEAEAETVIEQATLKKPVITAVKSKKKHQLTAKFDKVKNAEKYKVQVSTDKNFKKKKTTTTTVTAKKATIKKLKSGKKYYVRVRAVGVDGTKSAWSKTAKIKVK